MLQQTQVETVIPYFRRFVEQFPDLVSLAEASLDEVLRLWSGLGYYARARNLHRTAVEIASKYMGEFPQSLEAAMSLPGIGRSTAGAILAQACGQRHPILDGNVKRVLCRYHAIEGYPGQRKVENRLWEWAERHTPHQRVSEYTQAVMDLGATVCLRRKPRCDYCPLAAGCRALARGEVERYPAARPKLQRPLRHVTHLILRNSADEILLRRLPPAGIWGGLWSFPEHGDEDISEEGIAVWCRQELGLSVTLEMRLPPVRHGFTHFELQISPLLLRTVETGDQVMESGHLVWYNLQGKSPGGLPAPVKRLLQTICSTNREGLK